MTTPQEKHHPNWQDRIVKDPQILAGKPVIKGTRISVELITDFLEGGMLDRSRSTEELPPHHTGRHRRLPPLQGHRRQALQLHMG